MTRLPSLLVLAALALLVGPCAHRPPAPPDPRWAKIERLFTPPADLAGAPRDGRKSPLAFYDGRKVAGPADWPARRREIRDRWHALMGAWPPLLERPALRILESASVDGLARHRVELPVAPGRTTVGYLMVPPGPGPHPAALTVFYEPESAVGLNPSIKSHYDFGVRLARRGFVTLNIGQPPSGAESPLYYPSWENARLQPLSFLAYVAANAAGALAARPEVDPRRVGVVGHSYGGKWALFAAALSDRFAAVAVSDPGVVFDETHKSINYWDPWYLGYAPGLPPPAFGGLPGPESPRTGAYKRLVEGGHDLHELHALIAPRPFLVSGAAAGGPAADRPERWQALAHAIAVGRLLGHERRVGMSNDRPDHGVTAEAAEQITLFFEHFLESAP